MMLDAAAADRAITRGRIVTLLGVAALAGLYVMAVLYTPTERFQGLVQKIFYVHPPAAYAMQLAFVMTGIASALYLWLRDAGLEPEAPARMLPGEAYYALVARRQSSQPT